MPSDLTRSQRRLTAARAKRRRADLGPPLAYSRADLDILTNVGPTDQVETTAFVRATKAGQRGVDMLEAR